MILLEYSRLSRFQYKSRDGSIEQRILRISTCVEGLFRVIRTSAFIPGSRKKNETMPFHSDTMDPNIFMRKNSEREELKETRPTIE